ncbi:MAG: helix-turn-helix transcriptional regulator [Bacteroidales bacterium]|nr:helix-turn-helix transcriptional regulator [Bacteroidales bacterium]
MLEPVLYICLVQSLFAGIVIASKRPQLQADRFLAAWLFIIAAETFLALVKLNLLDRLPYKLPFLIVPFLYGPLLLFYVRALIFEHTALRTRDLLHLIPFILLLGLTFLFKEPSENYPSALTHSMLIRIARIIINALLFLSLTTYSTIIYILLNNHRKKIKEKFSYQSGKITLRWLLFVSITVYVSYFFTFLTATIQLFNIILPFDPMIFSYTGLTLISFAFSFYGYRQAVIYHDSDLLIPQTITGKKPGRRKYARSKLTIGDLQKYIRAMDRLMKTEQWYLNPELTLDQVARKLEIPKHHLTQALNTELHKNFYLYINEYRVEAFKTFAQDTRYRDFTLLAIAYECGFNSKSTFNTVFKRMTGQTPSEYLHSIRK